jgi:histone deacetylase complex regulatory component SIN3
MLEKYAQRNAGSTVTAPSAVPSVSPSYNRDTQYEPGLEPPELLGLLKAYYYDIGLPIPAVPSPRTQYVAAPAAKDKREEVGEFEAARNFVSDVKRAYEHRPEVYRSFLDILHNYHQKE